MSSPSSILSSSSSTTTTVSYINSSEILRTSAVRFFSPNATSIINLSKRSTFNCRNDDHDDEMDQNDEDDYKDDYCDDNNIVDETVPKHNQ